LFTLPDISSFLDEIFVPNISKKTQAENIRGIKEDVNTWLLPLVIETIETKID